MTDLERAKALLKEHGCVAAACKTGECDRIAYGRGVAPLLDWLDQGVNLTGYSAADKVVGKAAAFLYLRLGVAALYAETMSASADALLNTHGVTVSANQVVPAIRNRAGTGYCPMETVTTPISDPLEAEAAIHAKLAELLESKN